MLHKLILIALTISIIGCGSTNRTQKVIDTPNQPVNAGIAKLVKFGILDAELADGMALKAAQQRLDDKNNAKNNAYNSVTGQGSLVSGFVLSSVLGAGLSLGDFLSPSNIYLAGLGTKKEFMKHESPVVFIEIPMDCNEECAKAKFKAITRKVHNRHSELMGKGSDVIGEIKIEDGSMNYDSDSYYTEDKNGKYKSLLFLAEPEIFMVGGKYYYGGNPTVEEVSYSAFFFGEKYAEDIDFGINAIIEVSEEHPELYTYMPKKAFFLNKDGTGTSGCRGNIIIENGKVEQMFEMFGCKVYANEDLAMTDRIIFYP